MNLAQHLSEKLTTKWQSNRRQFEISHLHSARVVLSLGLAS